MSVSSSPVSTRRRPCDLCVDGGHDSDSGQCATATTVDRLLTDIAFQWQREQQRLAGRGRRRRRQPRNDVGHTAVGMAMEETATASNAYDDNGGDYDDDEAASAYWWTDVFLRYFVFDDDRGDCTKPKIAADSDDLLFFVRRRRRRKSKRRQPTMQRRRRVAYDTRAYRKQQKQQNTLLPIGDPAILWRHTVCLNTIVHRLQYTLTVAVCARVPRKTTSSAGIEYYYENNDTIEFGFDDGSDQEYDLQVLSRHVHTVYASTSGRRMDADKGPRERPVYPAVCWAADDYAEAFRTVIVRPGQTVCAELVASWPGPPIVEEYINNDDNDCEEYNRGNGNNYNLLPHRLKLMPVNLGQNKNRAVLFTGAIPYAAVRAAYECKMSLYREVERQRRKQKEQQRKCGGKKSSLGAALSASLTALFTGGKDSATTAGGYSADYGDYDYYYGPAASSAKRVEYVTVRGCRPGCDNDECELTLENNSDFDLNTENISMNNDSCDHTKGLAQMAIALASVQPLETTTSVTDYYDGEYNHQYNSEDDLDDIEDNYTGCYDDANYTATPVGYQHQLEPSSYAAPATTSEPGDYYDYGWDYETAASSGHQTPQTPVSYHYQQQQQQQLERQRRRGGRPRRLSDPCSTSVYDMIENNYEQQNQYYTQQKQQQQRVSSNNVYGGSGDRRKPLQQYNHQNYQQQQPVSHGNEKIALALTPPVRMAWTHHPHRAWSESDGLDRCGGGGSLVQKQQQSRQKPILLPPPPVPYYCAAEAAASGFVQYVRKSPGCWWARMRNRRRRRRARSKRRKQKRHGGTTTDRNLHRSSSAGCNRNGNGCCTTTDDDENSGDSGSEGGGVHGDNDTDSDNQDSDGEFIGALAAAAVVGHDPDHDWSQAGLAGDPVADWERYDGDYDSDTAADDSADDNGVMAIEWTAEIVASDLRRRQPLCNVALPSRITTLLYDNDFNNWCGRPSPLPMTPVTTAYHPQPQLGPVSRQQHRCRRPPHQLRPQPLEPPPPPPALSVAFTVVACPWWTVLEDVLLVNTTTTAAMVAPSSSNKTVSTSPLLTFD